MIGGSLFTRYFLQEGIQYTDAYRALDSARVETARVRMANRWRAFSGMRRPSEAETESEFIYPVLGELGWEWLVQPVADMRRRDIADALLFQDSAAKQAARNLPPLDRFAYGAVIVENEARETSLDRAPTGREAPGSQILRYMSRAEAQSNGRMQWGLLTNAKEWRLYYAGATSRVEGYVGINIANLLNPQIPPHPQTEADTPVDHWMRVFLLLFTPAAFRAEGPGGVTLLDQALAEGRRYEARVTAGLSAAIFDDVFLMLVRAFAEHDGQAKVSDPDWRNTAREGAIRLLYRLLFLLYAEDRDLLPTRHAGYSDYSLQALRREAAALIDRQAALSARAGSRWEKLKDLFAAIAEGDGTLGLPPYNGGLFKERPGDILNRVRLPDTILVQVVDRMSREGAPGETRRWINYRDLSVQHLGGIYERLLEHDVVPHDLLRVALLPSPYARKTSGSYYTRDELVRLILRQAIDPLILECREAFNQRLEEMAPDAPLTEERLDHLRDADPAEAILGLRLCDPAMGSGHFLVSLVDHLTDAVIKAMADANSSVPAGAYRSPVSERIEGTRQRILENARNQRWAVEQGGLDDKHIVRRMVLKQCVFGVDLNPMAVELAKLSLWLHSFTVGAPLSFLDHHLRCGDSLFGEFVGRAVSRLRDEYGLAVSQAVTSAEAAAGRMADIERLPDADIADVHASGEAFRQVEASTAPLRAFLDLYHASRWLPAADDTDKIGRNLLFGGNYGDPVEIAQGATMRSPGGGAPDVRRATKTKQAITARAAYEAARSFVDRARNLASKSGFLHWEAAFPGLWRGWETAAPIGGFHAVIGNPPWDRIKMQEVEWWAARNARVAALSRAADRKAAIADLRGRGDPMAAMYDRAAARARLAAEVAAFLPKPKKNGTLVGPYPLYPLFAKGDVNIYSLFVERAGQLVRPEGIVGLLVPSGVAADKGAAAFFRSVTETGRLSAFLDFENRRTALGLPPFFPAVDSRFKFAALVHGGTRRHFPATRCAFFQQDVDVAVADAFTMTPEDFSRINPNTGTAPVFRSRRDAEIVIGIYNRLPVLIDRRGEEPEALYSVAYATHFHMSSDSRLFRTAEELEGDGAYPVADGAFERGNTRFLPLMVGRSIHLFDHRFASVMEEETDEELGEEDEAAEQPPAPRGRNIHNPYSSSLTTAEQHADPTFRPRPRYWVDETELEGKWPEGLDWALAFRDIARPTDVRTAIAAIVPRSAFGNTLPLLLPALPDRPRDTDPPSLLDWENECRPIIAEYKETAHLLMGNLGALVFDFVVRNKVQSTHLNLYILEQIPMVPPAAYDRFFGDRSAADIVRSEVLALTYTDHAMAPFARDLGFMGEPFVWDMEDRLRRRARLDAVYMLLYGVTREDAGYILDTFPILKRAEEESYGRYRTRDLVLRYMAALEAGNPNAAVEG